MSSDKILRDVRLQNFENSAFAFSALRITPGEAYDGADTSLRENCGRDLHIKFLDSRPQLSSNDRAYILRPDIANSIFEPLQRIPQCRTKVLVAGDDLSQFLQAGNFSDQPQQPHFRGSVQRKLKLLQQFGSKPRGRKPRNHEHHCVPHRGAPCQISLRDQPLDWNDLVDDPARHGVPHGLPGRASQARLRWHGPARLLWLLWAGSLTVRRATVVDPSGAGHLPRLPKSRGRKT